MRRYIPRGYKRRSRSIANISQFNFKLNPKIIGLAAVFLVLLAVLVYLGKIVYTSDIFRVKEIKTNVALDKRLIELVKGKSLFTLDIQKVYYQICKYCPEYKEVRVLREFPSALRIEVCLRKPFAQLKAREFFAVDREGYVIAFGQEEKLPDLIPIDIGSNNNSLKKNMSVADEKLEDAFKLIEVLKTEGFLDRFAVNFINASSLEAMYFLISEKEVNQDVKVSNEIKVIIGDGDLERKLYVFNNLLKEQLTDGFSSIQYVDLRYKKVYLGFKK